MKPARHTHPATLVLSSPDTDAPASREQKTFARVKRQLAEMKHHVEAWRAMVPVYHARVASGWQPLLDEYNRCRSELLRVLDQGHGAKALTRRERSNLSNLISRIAAELIDAGETAPEVVQLHDKHSDRSAADKERADAELLRAMSSAMGMNLDGLGDDATPGQVAERVQAELAAMEAEEEQAAEPEPSPASRRRKPSARTQAREARASEDRQRVAQSLREVFRKLASALHPDREPDPQQRERKNALMQRVNAAYAREDLLQLLELQLEVEHVDLSAAAVSLGDAHVRHFNKVLKEQIGELEQELQRLQTVCDAFDPFRTGSGPQPAAVLHALERDIESLQADIRRAKRDAMRLADVPTLKAWLKDYRPPAQDDEADSLLELMALKDLLDKPTQGTEVGSGKSRNGRRR